MDKTPLFSIIIPTFNVENVISACLGSILNQTFLDYEVLIQDGFSTDSTVAIATALNNDRIKIFVEKDAGVYDAMNKAITNAKGSYIYFLGSDDVLFNNNVLEILAQELVDLKCDFIYGNVQLTSNLAVVDEVFSKLKLLTEKNICHQAIFYKKTIFEQLGNFNLNYKIWADWDLNIRCFSHPNFKIKHVNTTVAIYNDETGVSAAHDKEFITLLPLNSRFSTTLRSSLNTLGNYLTFTDLLYIGYTKLTNIVHRVFKLKKS